MSNIKKKIYVNDEEVEVTFFHDLSEKKLKPFLEDIDHNYNVLEDTADVYTCQFVHALLIIKHFTDFPLKIDNVEDLLTECKIFIDTGLLEKFAVNFKRSFLQEVNKHVINNFLKMYDEVPEYLKFGPNAKAIEELEYERNFKNRMVTDAELNEIKVHIVRSPESKPNKRKAKSKKKLEIDDLLDEYNHYNFLFKILEDEKYKERAKHIMRVLQKKEKYIELKDNNV